MKWMKERDLLIAQTMAFVQSVTGKRPDFDQPVVTPPATDDPPSQAAVPAQALDPSTPVTAAAPRPGVEPSNPAPPARVDVRGDFQSEIRARVANFRAQQQRFLREREAYGTATMARVHASLKDDPALPRLDK